MTRGPNGKKDAGRWRANIRLDELRDRRVAAAKRDIWVRSAKAANWGQLQQTPKTWEQLTETVRTWEKLNETAKSRDRFQEVAKAKDRVHEVAKAKAQLNELIEAWEQEKKTEARKSVQARSVATSRRFWRRLASPAYILGGQPVVDVPPPRGPSQLEKCRSIVGFAKHFLPRDKRDDFADECLDEIEAAAEAGRPVFRRTASILLRALPVLIVRSRFPTRARKAGAKGE